MNTTIRRPMRPTRAPHGTVRRYWAGCSCAPCRAALREYHATHRPMVDAELARRRIAQLRRAGMSINAIAMAAGLDRATLGLIVRGRRRMVHAETFDALMGVSTAPFDARVLVSAKRPRALARRMAAAGHSRRAIAQAGGIPMAAAAELLRSRHRRRVLATTALGIERAARELGILRSAEEVTLRLLPDAFDAIVERAGWEVEAIVEAAGLDTESYQQIRAGRRVGEERAERIAIALGVRVATVFEAA